MPIPIIDCTDLYHPHQDPGDNFDILAAYALEELDLRAVILDVTDRFRKSYVAAGGFTDANGPREAGIIPLTQTNYIFDRTVPFAVSPFAPMKSVRDRMRDVPRFEQAGIELFLDTLRASPQAVDVLVFCSCRTLAAAINREPQLCQRKIRRIHLSSGTASGELFDVDWRRGLRLPRAKGSPGYCDWNVELDVHAFVRVLRSGLPLSLYPCSGDHGGLVMDRHNTFWMLKSLTFIERMDPPLRNYLAYAFTRHLRHDFLAAMEEPMSPSTRRAIRAIHRHPVWETAIWLGVTGRKLVHRPRVGYRIIRPRDLRRNDRVLQNDQVPCRLKVRSDGRFDFTLTDKPTHASIYDRGSDLQENERALQEALPALYLSFRAPCRK